MKRDKYLYLSSDDSLNYFSGNTPADFFVKLPHSFILEGLWECALVQFQFVHEFFSDPPLDLFVCADICSESFMKDSKPPVLRRIHNSYSPSDPSNVVESQISNLFYIPIIKEFVDVIHVYILDKNKDLVSFSKGPSSVTLHFRRVRGF